MLRVVHFNLTADDLERAKKFYSEVFDWSFEKWDGPMEYWLIKTGNDKQSGINGGLAKRNTLNPSTVNTIDVPSIDEYTKKIQAKGGKVIQGMPVKGVGYFAHCTDTEGNRFDIIQFDKNTK
jgi:uncharacterized protein